MGVYVCSLMYQEARDGQQLIPPGEYTLVRFPYGAAEPYDPWGMHQLDRDGATHPFPDDAQSGLIWPTIDGWGHLYAEMHLADGDYTEIRSRYVRDPLNLGSGYDSTATEDEQPTPGGQYEAKNWGIVVHPDVSLGFLIHHNASAPVRLVLAQLKLAIQQLAIPQ